MSDLVLLWCEEMDCTERGRDDLQSQPGHEDSHQFIRKLDASHVGSHHLVIPLRETEYLHSLASVFVSVVQYKESVRFFFKIQAMCLKSHTFREVLESHAMS